MVEIDDLDVVDTYLTGKTAGLKSEIILLLRDADVRTGRGLTIDPHTELVVFHFDYDPIPLIGT